MEYLYINWWPLAILLAVTTLELFNKKGSTEEVFVSIIIVLAGACALAFTETWWVKPIWFVAIGGIATSDRGIGQPTEMTCLVAAFTAIMMGAIWLCNWLGIPAVATFVNYVVAVVSVLLVRGASKN